MVVPVFGSKTLKVAFASPPPMLIAMNVAVRSALQVMNSCNCGSFKLAVAVADGVLVGVTTLRS